jgi:hypothetical protein
MSVCLALLAAISLTSWLTLVNVEPGYLALQSFQVSVFKNNFIWTPLLLIAFH